MESWIREVMQLTGEDYSSVRAEYEATHDEWKCDYYESQGNGVFQNNKPRAWAGWSYVKEYY